MFKHTRRAVSFLLVIALAIAAPLTAFASEGSSFGRPVPQGGARVTFTLPKNDCYLEEDNSFAGGRIEDGPDVPDTLSASGLEFTLINAPATYTRSPGAYHFTVSDGFAVRFAEDTPVGGGLGGTYMRVGDGQYGQYITFAYGCFAEHWVPDLTDNFSADDYSEYMVMRFRNADGIQITVTFSYESSPTPMSLEPSSQTLPIEGFNADINAAITGITPSTWAANAVTKAREYGFITKATNWAFQTATTRGEFCRLAVSFLDSYGYDINAVTPKVFADTDDRYIGIAAALKITSGTNTAGTEFTPNRALTREEAATMLSNVMNVIGAKYDTAAVAWSDAKDVSSWAQEAVSVMYNAKIMGGTSTTALVFSPKTSYTHEQSISTLVNLWEFVKK